MGVHRASGSQSLKRQFGGMKGLTNVDVRIQGPCPTRKPALREAADLSAARDPPGQSCFGLRLDGERINFSKFCDII